ncbi:endonuclease dU [Methanosphaerula palustris]|uniref:UPF0215 protein Mpal_1538 n=1 Tax=Methanosphaerula palustris (strain ATCC BAA-1556 / DSM 19958 / E1-9c) TaxID=521011 RepID=B8GIN8_METPE|nr:DUF99 family protein [Methanosphaerula palustris]ACL16851.1 protein of unknown function DUF99 [Methanosphaerula palustris E1-9c]
MHLEKKGLRVAGIAESFFGSSRSTLACVVMRRDLRIDGVAFGSMTVGGMDATRSIIDLIDDSNRKDVNLVMISGCVIAWFNIIDPEAISQATGLPVIAVTYEESDGLENEICSHFPGDQARLAQYRNLGERIPFLLSTGKSLYLRLAGINIQEAGFICDQFTFDGRIPEPLRVARLMARSLMRGTGSAR